MNFFLAFSWLFEPIIGPNMDPTYREAIYLFSGLLMLITGVGLSALYYLIVNGFSSFAKLRYGKHWFLFMLAGVVLVFFITLTIAKKQTDSDPDAYMYSLSILNAVLTGLVFFLSSIIFKCFSLHAKYTPFKWLLIK